MIAYGEGFVDPDRWAVLENVVSLREIAATKPRNLSELAEVQGVGAVKLERYGKAMLAALSTNG